MNRIALCVAALSIAACQDAPTAPAPTARPSATVEFFGDAFVEPFAYDMSVSCANGGLGELVALIGTRRTWTQTMLSDNAYVSRFFTQLLGVTGVGLSTGVPYQQVGVQQSTVTERAQSGTVTDTYTSSYRMIALGAAPDFVVHATEHLTRNASGQIVAVVESLRAECQ